MKIIRLLMVSFTFMLITILFTNEHVVAQRVYDEFDAPSINYNTLYKDISYDPSTLVNRYNGPYQLNDMPYQELTASFPERVIFNTPSNLDDAYFQVVTTFNMQYDNNSYPAGSNLWVSTNGFVVIGGSAEPVQPYSNSNLLFMNQAPLNVIAPYWGNHRYVDGITEISWQVLGVSPKRQLVIQWKNIDINHDGSNNHNYASFQLILWERSIFKDRTHNQNDLNSQSDIDFVYGDAVVSNLSFLNNSSVGIKGSNGEYVNALTWNNQSQASISKQLTQFWPPSGNANSRIRLESYQKSINVPYSYFESRLIPPQPPLGLRTDPDEGYYRIDLSSLNFNYTFGGAKQPYIWVNVNGFATFQNPDVFSSIANNVSNALFINSASYPNSVVAPFWGDHYYRRAGETTRDGTSYLPSEISYMITGSYPNRRIIIQWKNLNILAKDVPSSVGNFQAIIYEGIDDKYPGNFAGGIEFAYGDVGNPNLPSAPVVTNASVGLKGNTFGVNSNLSDYINGLTYDNPKLAFSSQQLTTIWRPSGGMSSGEGRRIFFRAIPRWFIQGWGDGDANLSQIRTRKHGGMIQNRFVTVDDARLVLRWQVKENNLPDSLKKDSIRLGNAYHADVNHDGRYYYSTRTWDNIRDTAIWKRTIDRDTTGKRIKYDSLESLTGLPADAGPIRLIYFDANALDAALILHYISGRVFSLPWIFDTIPGEVGKISNTNKVADNIKFGKSQTLSNNDIIVPLYLNGNIDGPVSIEFDSKNSINYVKSISALDNIILTEFNDNRFALAADGNFNSDYPIAYISFKNDDNAINISNIVINGIKKDNQSVEIDNSSIFTGDIYPNPANDIVNINIDSPSDDDYTVSISDIIGRNNKVIFNGKLSKGNHIISRNLNDLNFNDTGVYVINIHSSSVIKNIMLNVVK